MGSGAPVVGRLVADMFNIGYVDREIIADVAARLNLPEQVIVEKEMPASDILGRIGEALSNAYPAGAGYSGAYLPAWEIPLDNAQYLSGLESVIKEIAKNKSIVIRGRGSQFILKDFPKAFHVLLVAPLDIRIKRVMERLSLSEEEAKKEVARFDGSRKEFTRRYFGAELEDPVNYDLVINTRHLSYKVAAKMIVDSCKSMGKK